MKNSVSKNTYANRKRLTYKIIDIKILEENLLDYSNWLRENNRKDKIENYEKFLQV